MRIKKKTYENPIEHGHLDEEEIPEAGNLVIHSHDYGDKSHIHDDEPTWGAIGNLYIRDVSKYEWLEY